MFLSSSNRIFHLSLQNLCIKIMKRRLYIFSIWIATMGMLLSTVMLHHHHYERICMVVEVCSQDGSLNDEHTEHHDTEHEGCQVKQMHHFIVKNRVVESAVKKLLDAHHLQVFVLPAEACFFCLSACVATEWQALTLPLSEELCSAFSRRGPPLFS